MTTHTLGATRDAPLVRRTAAALAAVLAVDLLAVFVLSALLRPWLGPVGGAVAAALGLSVPPPVGWVAFWLLALALFLRVQLRYTRAQTLAAVDAEPASAADRPALHRRVTRLAQQADVEPPELAVVASDVPNCLTVGSARDATVVVSEGLLEALDDGELDAALAHELAHVKNGDVTVMTLASFLPAVASGEYSLLAAISPRGWSPRATLAVVGAAFGALALAGVVVADAGVNPLVAVGALALFSALFGGTALGLAAVPVVHFGRRFSRTREFSADRAAALITGDPAALATALRKLDGASSAPRADARTRSPTAVRGLCLLPRGFDGADATGDDALGLGDVRSHPPVSERIALLRELVRELERSG